MTADTSASEDVPKIWVRGHLYPWNGKNPVALHIRANTPCERDGLDTIYLFPNACAKPRKLKVRSACSL